LIGTDTTVSTAIRSITVLLQCKIFSFKNINSTNTVNITTVNSMKNVKVNVSYGAGAYCGGTVG
jgi:hypothetical protein